MSNGIKFAFLGGAHGLIIAISLAYGINISKEGIAMLILYGIKPTLPLFGYAVLNFLILTSGIISVKIHLEKLSEEESIIKVIFISWFLAMLFIYLGMSWGLENLEKLGVIPLLIGLLSLYGDRN